MQSLAIDSASSVCVSVCVSVSFLVTMEMPFGLWTRVQGLELLGEGLYSTYMHLHLCKKGV